MRTNEQIAESIDAVVGNLCGKLYRVVIKTAVNISLFTASMIMLLTIIEQI